MRFFFSLVFFFFVFTLSAQPVGFQAPPDKANVPFLRQYFASDSTGYYCAGNVMKQLYIEKLDSDLVPVKFVSTGRLQNGNSKREYVAADYLGKNFVLLTWGWDRKQKQNQLFGEFIDRTTLKIAPGPVQLLSSGIKGYADPGYFQPVVSTDHSRMLVFCEEQKGLNGDKRIHFKVLNDSLQNVWEKTCSIYLSADSSSIRQVSIDAQGRIFLLVREMLKNGKSRYHCIAIRDQGTFVKAIPLDPHGTELYEPRMNIASDGSVNVTGFYKGDYEKELAGVCFIKLEKFGYQPVVSVITPFLPDFFSRFAERHKEDPEYVPTLFRAKNSQVNSDGGSTFVAEYAYSVTSHQLNSGDNTIDLTTVQHTVYGDVVVFRFNADGTLAWESLIGKKQETDGSAGNLSCAVFFDGDLTRIIYNDNIAYESTPVVTATTVDNNGKITVTPVSGIPEGSIVYLSYCAHLNPDELLVFCAYKYEYRKGSILFKQ